MELKSITANLEQKGYEVSVFDTGAEAVRYLKGSITGQTIGFGGSQTLTELNLRMNWLKTIFSMSLILPRMEKHSAVLLQKQLTRICSSFLQMPSAITAKSSTSTELATA